MEKIISYSLYSSSRGSCDRYVRGALRAADLNALIYPDWAMHVYVSADLQAHVAKLESSGVLVHPQEHNSRDQSGLYWRYKPICTSATATLLFRDCDCRPSRREQRLVDLWLESTKTFHIIRDVPHHRRAIMGGLRGVRNPPEWLRDAFANRIQAKRRTEVAFGDDEDWLETDIYPRFHGDVLEHDSQRDPSPFVDEQDGYLVGQSDAV